MKQNNQQSPTPETDAMFIAFNRREPNAIDPADFTRKLERERDEARERERIALASWDEERLRGQREAERVIALQQQLETMREALQWILNSASDGSIPDGRNLWAITQNAQRTLGRRKMAPPCNL